MTILVLSALFVVSTTLNAILVYRYRTRPAKRAEDYSVRELLHDLTAGPAVVEIKRIDPSNVIIRSPRTPA